MLTKQQGKILIDLLKDEKVSGKDYILYLIASNVYTPKFKVGDKVVFKANVMGASHYISQKELKGTIIAIESNICPNLNSSFLGVSNYIINVTLADGKQYVRRNIVEAEIEHKTTTKNLVNNDIQKYGSDLFFQPLEEYEKDKRSWEKLHQNDDEKNIVKAKELLGINK